MNSFVSVWEPGVKKQMVLGKSEKLIYEQI